MIKVKSRGNETAEQMIRRFKKVCEKEGLTKDIKRVAYYEKPSEKRRPRVRRAGGSGCARRAPRGVWVRESVGSHGWGGCDFPERPRVCAGVVLARSSAPVAFPGPRALESPTMPTADNAAVHTESLT